MLFRGIRREVVELPGHGGGLPFTLGDFPRAEAVATRTFVGGGDTAHKRDHRCKGGHAPGEVFPTFRR